MKGVIYDWPGTDAIKILLNLRHVIASVTLLVVETLVEHAPSRRGGGHAGQRSIEHLTRVADACSKEESPIDSELQRFRTLFRQPAATVAQKVDAGRNILLLNARTVASFDEDTAQSLFAWFVKNRT